MNSGRLLPVLLLFFCGFTLPVVAAENIQVQLVLSDGSAIYQSFLAAFRQALPPLIRLNVVQRAEEFESMPVDLVVTVGVKAAERVALERSAPMLAVMVPFGLDLSRARNKPLSALYFEQPWHRQVHFIRTAFPERRRIGVLHSVDAQQEPLRTELKQHGGTLVSRPLRSKESLFSDLDDLLSESEVLLATRDSAVYNSHTIRNILLSSYRRGIPLVGFSSSYVKAGALCAIFSTPDQLALQTTEMIQIFARTAKLPDAQYPTRYTIAVNQEVARTLGIAIKPADELHTQLERSSGDSR